MQEMNSEYCMSLEKSEIIKMNNEEIKNNE
jgi:hypothetical protein